MPTNDMTVSLHEHLIRLLENHEKLQDTELAAMDKALALARMEAEKQYLALNNLRKEYTEERKQFVEKSVYEAKHESLRVELNAVHRKLDDVNGNFKTWGSVVLAISVIVQLLLHLFWR